MAKITVDYDKCEGAGQCIAVCPSNVYILKSIDETRNLKGVPQSPEDCIMCNSCVKACPVSAITVESAKSATGLELVMSEDDLSEVDQVKSAVSGGYFEVYRGKDNQWRFRLKAANHKIIAVSEGYTSKAGCLNGIESVKKNAESETIDLS